MASATSLDLRRRVVEAYRRGGVTYAEVAARFAVGQASVSRWLRRARQTGDVKPLPHGGGYPRRISKEQEPIVERLVQEHPDWSEEELAKAVREKLSIQVSAVTVGRVVRRLGYSVKKKTLIATERDRADVVRRRREYDERIRRIAPARLVFVDETGSNTAMTRSTSRALVGERAFGKVPKSARINLTVVGAIALDGVRAMMAYEGGTTREAFLKFIRDALVPSLRKGDVVVMDNLRAHYTDGVQRSIEAVGASVMYLPPYSPELNPIELSWSKLKSILRRIGARSLRALVAALPLYRSEIRASDLTGWFRHAGYEHQLNG
jgi:transposase